MAPVVLTAAKHKLHGPVASDFWKQTDFGLIRMHRRSRLSTFTPKGNNLPCEFSELEDRRTIHVTYDNGTKETIEDFWNTDKSYKLKMTWSGETHFYYKKKPALAGTSDVTMTLGPVNTSVTSSGTAPREPTTSSTSDGTLPRTVRRLGTKVVLEPTLLPPGLDLPDASNTEVTRQQNSRQPLSHESTLMDVDLSHEPVVDPLVDVDNTEPSQEARLAKQLTCPMEPTPQERQLHNLTHLPYRTWCQECVTAKGKLEKHMRQPTKQPVIQLDYGFLGLEGDPTDRKLKLVTAVDITSGLGHAFIVDNKGYSNYAATELKRFFYETGRTNAILQCENEPAVKALCQQAVKGLPMALRNSPPLSRVNGFCLTLSADLLWPNQSTKAAH